MNPDIQSIVTYLQSHPDWQSQRDTIREQLLQVGWPSHLVDEAFTHLLVSAAVSPSQATPYESPTPSRTARPKKANPPIAAQIFFAFTCLAMLLGIIDVAITFYNAFKPNLVTMFLGFGQSRFATVVLGLYKIAYYGAFFWLSLQMRAQKKWALISISALVYAGFSNILIVWLGGSFVARLIYGLTALIELIVYAIAAGLVGVLWIKNRNNYV